MFSTIKAIKWKRPALFVAAALMALVVAQDCGQPQCPDGTVPCNAGVDASGAVCWSCCAA